MTCLSIRLVELLFQVGTKDLSQYVGSRRLLTLSLLILILLMSCCKSDRNHIIQREHVEKGKDNSNWRFKANGTCDPQNYFSGAREYFASADHYQESHTRQEFLHGELNGIEKHSSVGSIHICEYRNGKRHGVCKFFRQGWALIEMSHYSDGNRDGLAMTWTKGGKPIVLEPYKNCMKEGSRTLWWPDGGMRRKSEYKKDELNGIDQFWYQNGRIKKRETYKEGKLHGPAWHWDETGLLKKRESYCQGEPCGEWRQYTKDGQSTEIADKKPEEPPKDPNEQKGGIYDEMRKEFEKHIAAEEKMYKEDLKKSNMNEIKRNMNRREKLSCSDLWQLI